MCQPEGEGARPDGSGSSRRRPVRASKLSRTGRGGGGAGLGPLLSVRAQPRQDEHAAISALDALGTGTARKLRSTDAGAGSCSRRRTTLSVWRRVAETPDEFRLARRPSGEVESRRSAVTMQRCTEYGVRPRRTRTTAGCDQVGASKLRPSANTCGRTVRSGRSGRSGRIAARMKFLPPRKCFGN